MLYVTHRGNFPPDAFIDSIPGLRAQLESHCIPDHPPSDAVPPKPKGRRAYVFTNERAGLIYCRLVPYTPTTVEVIKDAFRGQGVVWRRDLRVWQLPLSCWARLLLLLSECYTHALFDKPVPQVWGCVV
jgi:hypothetical protein